MKMKLSSIAIAATAFAISACNSSAPKEDVKTEEAKEVKEASKTSATYKVDTEGDEVMWEGFTTYTPKSHYGTIQVEQGQLKVEEGKIVGGKFTIDMNSIHSVDLADDEEMYQKLVGHLKSPDFFAVDSFPKAKFEVTMVQKASEDDTTGASHHISGNLTMRGVTKNITIPAMVSMQDNAIELSTPEFVIDRSKWNVRFRSTSFSEFADVAKDKAIDDNIKLQINLEAKKA